MEKYSFENIVNNTIGNIDIDTENIDLKINRKLFKKAFITSAMMTTPFALIIISMSDYLETYLGIIIITIFMTITFTFHLLLYKTILIIKLLKYLFQKLNEINKQ